MDHPTPTDNPYAAPATNDAALDRTPKESESRIALAMWLAGMGICGAVVAFDRLLPVKLASEVMSVGFSVGIGFSSVAAFRIRRRWYVTLFLIVGIFIDWVARP